MSLAVHKEVIFLFAGAAGARLNIGQVDIVALKHLKTFDQGAGLVGGAEDQGGLVVAGGPGGFAERTVSLTDLAWVLVARDDVRENGGLLDEQRVNRLRYLEGTRKGSTRWIDTGWALALVGAVDGAVEPRGSS